VRTAGAPFGHTSTYVDPCSAIIVYPFPDPVLQLITIMSISVSIAMYCLLQLYFMISIDIAPHRPLLQLFSVKAVVFLTFWQSALLGGLASLGIVKNVSGITFMRLNPQPDHTLYTSRPGEIHVSNADLSHPPKKSSSARCRTADEINVGIAALLQNFEMV
jgi:uncharacterized protein Usg